MGAISGVLTASKMSHQIIKGHEQTTALELTLAFKANVVL